MDEPLRLLLISWHQPSSDAIGAQRVRSFLRHLPGHGWEIDLITRDAGLRFEGVRVHSVGDPVASFRQNVVGPNPRGWRRLASGFVSRAAIPDEQLLWSLRAAARARGLVPDVVLVSGPPFSQWVGAQWIARRCQVPLVCDYRDLWTQSAYFRGGRWRRRVERRLESWTWRQLAASTTVSQPLAEELADSSGKPSHVVMNGFEPDKAVGDMVDTTGPLTLVHCGQLYAGKRDPAPIFEAVKRAGLGPGDVRLKFFGPHDHLVRREAESYGVQNVVEVHSTIPHSDALAIQREADALMLLLWNHPREMGVYSGKLFEYLAARRRVLMLGYEHGVAAGLICERGIGVVANHPESIANVLRDWLQLKRAGKLELLPPEAARGLTRAEQAAELARVLNQLGRRRRPS